VGFFNEVKGSFGASRQNMYTHSGTKEDWLLRAVH